MNEKQDLQKELAAVVKQKDEMLEEKKAILHAAHVLKLREIQIRTILQLEEMHGLISNATPEAFGEAFGLFQKSTTGKLPAIQVLIEFPKEEKNEEKKVEPKEMHAIKEAVMTDEERKDKAIASLPNLTEAQKYVLAVIGRTGVSRNQELRAFLEQDETSKNHFERNGKFSYMDMSAVTKVLKDTGYLLTEKVNLGSKGGYNFHVFELSKLGLLTYDLLTNEPVAPPEKQAIMAQHKSLEHGYLIKDCATEFEDMGYTVLTERHDLRFELPDGKRKDFDLILAKDGEKAFIEIERGTHTDEDFFNAMDRIYQVMQQLNGTPVHFHFIAPNEQTLFGKTKRQFFLWVKQRLGGIDEVKGKIAVHFTTFDKIKRRQKEMWEDIEL